MDLNSFSGVSDAFENGIEIDIIHPVTSLPTGIKVVVASLQSERVKAVQRRIGNKALRDKARNPKRSTTVEEFEASTDDILAAAVVSWSGIEMDKKPLECTRENVLSIIRNPDLFFIREQIDKAADDTTAFMTASSKA